MQTLYRGVVPDTLLEHLTVHTRTWMNTAFNLVGIERMLAAATVFWPDIVEEDGYVFIAEFYTQAIEGLMERFGGDKRRIERWVNAWSLETFFLGDELALSPALSDSALLTAFGEILRHFWVLRLQTLFPNRRFIVEVGEEIEGELGLSITLYEALP
ncbi:MAG TPA: hypothetical protein VF807_03185 [Ktedonobacterales bacterium]